MLLQEKKALLSSKKELLISKVKEVKSGVKFGAILPSSELVLEAEIIKINQQLTEIKFENIKLLNNLSELTFSDIDTETTLIKPVSYPNSTNPDLNFKRQSFLSFIHNHAIMEVQFQSSGKH